MAVEPGGCTAIHCLRSDKRDIKKEDVMGSNPVFLHPILP